MVFGSKRAKATKKECKATLLSADQGLNKDVVTCFFEGFRAGADRKLCEDRLLFYVSSGKKNSRRKGMLKHQSG